MSETNPAPGGWNVTGQQEATRVLNGTAVTGYDVFFTTGQGHSGSVFLPTPMYTVDNVRAAVTTRAQLLDTIGALTA